MGNPSRADAGEHDGQRRADDLVERQQHHGHEVERDGHAEIQRGRAEVKPSSFSRSMTKPQAEHVLFTSNIEPALNSVFAPQFGQRLVTLGDDLDAGDFHAVAFGRSLLAGEVKVSPPAGSYKIKGRPTAQAPLVKIFPALRTELEAREPAARISRQSSRSDRRGGP